MLSDSTMRAVALVVVLATCVLAQNAPNSNVKNETAPGKYHERHDNYRHRERHHYRPPLVDQFVCDLDATILVVASTPAKDEEKPSSYGNNDQSYGQSSGGGGYGAPPSGYGSSSQSSPALTEAEARPRTGENSYGSQQPGGYGGEKKEGSYVQKSVPNATRYKRSAPPSGSYNGNSGPAPPAPGYSGPAPPAAAPAPYSGGAPPAAGYQQPPAAPPAPNYGNSPAPGYQAPPAPPAPAPGYQPPSSGYQGESPAPAPEYSSGGGDYSSGGSTQSYTGGYSTDVGYSGHLQYPIPPKNARCVCCAPKRYEHHHREHRGHRRHHGRRYDDDSDEYY
ncbi:hypothetical protein M3Y99_00882900 [Aphelenchoides fujianensis]|nr:hypothetical protein M3Y99_00882900 [Aphelenchoides fujianensis]